MGNNLETSPVEGEESTPTDQEHTASVETENADIQSRSIKFVCDICDRCFDTSKGLKIHRSYHDRLSKKIDLENFNRSSRSRQEFLLVDRIDSSQQGWNLPVIDENHTDSNSNAASDPNAQQNIPSSLNCSLCGFTARSMGGLKCHMKKHQRKDQINVQECSDLRVLHESIAFHKRHSRRLNQIPKGARASAADKLSKLIDLCLVNNDMASWRNLFLFSYTSLIVPDRDSNTSLTSAVKKNILSDQLRAQPSAQKQNRHADTTNLTSSLSKRIEAKVADGDVKNAFRLLTSEDSLAPDNEETYNILLSKHPSPSREIRSPPASDSVNPLFVDEQSVLKAIKNFKKGSAAGPDGIKPQFLKDMLAKNCGDAAFRLLKSITALMNFMLAGKLCPQICEYMYGAILIALKKKSGGIRPIAIGNTFRRLCARLSCAAVSDRMANYFSPKQVGFSVRGGCEAAVHSARKFISSITSPKTVMLKVDMENAFNSVERDEILTSIKENLPELFPFIWQSYSKPSLLLYGSRIINSSVGCQQGDPLGPLCFSLAIHPLVKKIQSAFNVFYLDDGTIGDDYNIVLKDFKSFMSECKELGLSVNQSKCELFIPMDSHKEEIISVFREVAPQIKIIEQDDLSLLGSPLTDFAANSILSSKINTYQLLSDRLKNIHHHTALFLLRNCMAVPMMSYLIRSAPIFQNVLLSKLDNILKSSLEHILNASLEDGHWNQATLPISLGGIGVRKLDSIAIPAYCSSVYSTKELVNQIFDPSININNQHLELAENIWKNLANVDEIPSDLSHQKCWDIPIATNEFNLLERNDLVDKARLIAVSEKESGDWLRAVPSPNLGTLLDPESLRIAVALRLGTKVYRAHTCRCGQQADEFGRHGLKCKKSAGRFPRHSAMNDLIKRALKTAEVPSLLEPVDISRDDNKKRVDGVTIVPWSHGRQLAWDATCVDPVCATYLNGSATQPCFASNRAAVNKRNHYRTVCNMYHFVAFAVDCLGGWSKEAQKFGLELGKRMSISTGEPKSLSFFRQRVSIAIQRGNSASVLGTIPSDSSLSEIHYFR